MTENAAVLALDERISKQQTYINNWQSANETALFETLRAIDFEFCRDILTDEIAPKTSQTDNQYRTFIGFGVNRALQQVVPDRFASGPFVLFPSKSTIQDKADDLLFHAGVLERASTLREWLAEGLLSARLNTLPVETASGIRHVLVLKTVHSSLHAEVVAIEQRKWMSRISRQIDGAWEESLEQRHREILPDLVRRVRVDRGWGIGYTTTKEIDRYFDEWGQLYLRRMWGHDLIGAEDKLGGHEFRDYLGVLAAISGRSQKHLCFACLLKRKYTNLDWRNLLTTYAPFDTFLNGLAAHLDADRLQLQQIIASLTLEPSNKDVHLTASEAAWAPLVRTNQDNLILPIYGLEINPFLFLLRDLQNKYRRDWDKITDAREKRWRKELNDVFPQPRWKTAKSGIILRKGRQVITDIDAAIYDGQTNELALFQMKWQQPVGRYGKDNRSAAKNFIVESNLWIDRVNNWILENGANDILERMSIETHAQPRVTMFILGRYNAHFSAKREAELSAVWSDWPHFIRAVSEVGRSSFGNLATKLRRDTEEIRESYGQESYFVPLGDMAIALNPSREPHFATVG